MKVSVQMECLRVLLYIFNFQSLSYAGNLSYTVSYDSGSHPMMFNDLSEAIVVAHGGVDKPLTIEYRIINPFKENFYSVTVPIKEVCVVVIYLTFLPV